MMKMTLYKHYIIAFWLTLAVSLSLMVGGFFTPPLAEIDGSILTAVGELFLWPTLGFAAKALNEGKKAHITKGNLDITIGEDDNRSEEN